MWTSSSAIDQRIAVFHVCLDRTQTGDNGVTLLVGRTSRQHCRMRNRAVDIVL